MKMKLNFILFFGLLFCLKISAQTQDWVQMMSDPNVNFYDVQAEFNNYWAGKTIEKGKGYKAFKRWEYQMAPRVYPSGDMTLPSKTYPNYRQWEIEQAQTGIPKSTSGNWSPMGPVGKPTNGGAGRVNFLRFDPTNSSTMYVGTPDGGLWKTTNDGSSWSTNTDQLPMIGVSDLAIDPINTQVMYLATGDSHGGDTYSIGVLKSIDGGATWVTTGLTWTASQGRSIGRLLINPTNPSIVMAFSNAGIFRSTNGGTSWTNPTGTFASIDAEFKPGDPNTIYACGTSVKRSTDGGATWTAITTGLTGVQRIAMAVTPANSAYVYLLVTENTNSGFKVVMRSTDSGATYSTRMSLTTANNIMGWDNGADTGGQGWYDVAIAASPTNAEEVYTGGVNTWKSTNGGTSFVLNTHWTGSYSKPYVHADIHDIQFLPGSGSTLFSTCDGGVFKSTTSGSTYTDLSSNLTIAQQYRIGLSTSNATLLVAGHQDNGTNKMNGTTWAQVYGGDGMEAFIDRTNNNIIYGSYVYGEYYKSTNGGSSFTTITSGLPAGTGSEEWLCAWHQDPVTATTLYAGGRSALYKTTNSGTSWSALGAPTGSGNITDFAVAPSLPTTIYAIKSGANAVSKSTNGGTSFTSASTGLPTSVFPTCITVSNTDANIVFVTFSGYGATNKVYKSINGGASWTNISTGLPNIPVNCIVFSNGSSTDAIYVGTDLGVYYRDNSTSWIEFSAGLPKCAVSDLEIYYATGRLRAGTFGRGTWDSDLYSNVPTVPVASFSAGSTTICEGQSIAFTNTSTGVPTSYAWSFPGGTPSNSTSTNPIVTYSTAGTYTVELTATNANGFNTSTQTAYITVTGASTNTLPVSEGFAGSSFPPTLPTVWSVVNLDAGATTWTNSAAVGVTPTAGNSMVFDNYNFDDSGNSDEVRLPKLNFTSYSTAEMTFDVAYAAYDAANVDGLEVVVSTDCGTTWTSLYNKTGSTVATSNLPTAAATTSAFTPTSAQWRQETINLNTYVGQSNVIISFKNLAGYGNKLYVDNINLTGTAVQTPPTASFTSNPSSSVCTSQNVQYTSTSTGSPSSYSWTFPGGTPSSSTIANPIVTYASAGSYNVSLVVTNASGSNTSTQTNFITVNSAPTITATTPGSRCGAGTVTLNATASGGTISWFTASSGGTSVGTGASFTTPSLSSSVLYYVETTSGGCTSTRTAVNATVNSQPSVNVINSQEVCVGVATTIISFTGSSSSSIYDWSNTNPSIGLSSSGSGNIVSFVPSSSGFSSITVTPSDGGCSGTPVTFSITVNAVPVVSHGSLAAVCSTSSPVSLTGGSPAGGTYSGTGVTSGSFNPAVAGAGSTTITYSYTQSGCTGTTTTAITVNAAPSIVATTPASSCGPASLTLGASASAGTISWYASPSGGTALSSGTSYTTGVLPSTLIYYAETSNGVCTSSRVAVEGTINPIPSVNATSQQNLCAGQSSSLILFTGSSSSSTYAWSNNNTAIGLAASGAGNIAVFTPNGLGTATISVIPTLNGCAGSPQSFQIVVNQSPTVTQTPLSQICVYGSPFTLTSGSPVGGTYSGTAVNAGSFNPSIAGVGTFPITYSYVQNGCTGTAVGSITVSACASIEEQTEQTLLLYPNPTSTILTVEGSDLVHYTMLELYDATGRVVQEWKVNKDKMSLDLSKYAVGSYSLHFKGIDNERIERVEIIK